MRPAARPASSAPSPESPDSRASESPSSVEVEHLVLDAGHRAPAGDHVPALHDAVGVLGGRAVERLRGGRAPVGEQLGLLGVGQPDAADVAARVVGEVEPAEHEPLLDGLELRDPVLVQRGERVALAAVLGRARRALATDVGEPCTRLRAEVVEPPVELVDDHLLAGQLVVHACHVGVLRSAGSTRPCVCARARRRETRGARSGRPLSAVRGLARTHPSGWGCRSLARASSDGRPYSSVHTTRGAPVIQRPRRRAREAATASPTATGDARAAAPAGRGRRGRRRPRRASSCVDAGLDVDDDLGPHARPGDRPARRRPSRPRPVRPRPARPRPARRRRASPRSSGCSPAARRRSWSSRAWPGVDVGLRRRRRRRPGLPGQGRGGPELLAPVRAVRDPAPQAGGDRPRAVPQPRPRRGGQPARARAAADAVWSDERLEVRVGYRAGPRRRARRRLLRRRRASGRHGPGAGRRRLRARARRGCARRDAADRLADAGPGRHPGRPRSSTCSNACWWPSAADPRSSPRWRCSPSRRTARSVDLYLAGHPAPHRARGARRASCRPTAAGARSASRCPARGRPCASTCRTPGGSCCTPTACSRRRSAGDPDASARPGLLALIDRALADGADDLVDRLLHDVRELHGGDLVDDAAVVVVGWRP